MYQKKIYFLIFEIKVLSLEKHMKGKIASREKSLFPQGFIPKTVKRLLFRSVLHVSNYKKKECICLPYLLGNTRNINYTK